VPVAVLFTIRFVVLFAIGDEVGEREAIVYREKIDAVRRLAAGEVEDLGRAGDLACERTDLAGLALPEAANLVAIGVVPLSELFTELAHAIAAWTRVPWFGNEQALAEQ